MAARITVSSVDGRFTGDAVRIAVVLFESFSHRYSWLHWWSADQTCSTTAAARLLMSSEVGVRPAMGYPRSQEGLRSPSARSGSGEKESALKADRGHRSPMPVRLRERPHRLA